MVLKHLLNIINRIVPKSDKRLVLVDGRCYPDAIYAILLEYINNDRREEFNSITVLQTTTVNEYLKGKNIRYIKYGSIRGFWDIFRANRIITDIMFGKDYLSEKQTVVNIWHGLGLKKILALADGYEKQTKPLATFAMAYSNYFTDIVSKCFLIDKSHVIESGSPRNDLFFKGNREDLNLIFKDAVKYKKIIIWMPTYRQSVTAASKDDGRAYPYGIPLIDEKSIVKLNSILEENNMFLIIKHHVLQDKQLEIRQKLSNIKIITSEDVRKTGKSLYQLIGQCDALITDYSSIFFEYMSLDRPICFAYDDMEEYNSKRGFMFENVKNVMIGYHAVSINGLLKFLQDIADDNDIYRDARKRFIEESEIYMDSNNSYRLLRALKIVR